MPQTSPLRNYLRWIAILALLVTIAGFLVSSGSDSRAGFAWGRKPAGHPQLVSVEPLPETDGEMCEWLPASAVSSLSAVLQGARAVGESIPTEAAKAEAAKRQPLRVIRDPYAAYSAVAIDPVHNEVVMADENLFSIVAYDRLENTPPKATMSEPKRILRGMNTDIEFQCALYVDPANGDIYAVNNDTLNNVVVFSHQARGDVAPVRSVTTPHSSFGIAVDEKNQEMLVTVQDDAAVITYRKSARNNDAPLRALQGRRTLLADPHGIAVDFKNDLMFVANWGSVNYRTDPTNSKSQGHEIPGSGKFLPPSITVYPRNASGDTSPSRMIQGPETLLNWPTALAFDPERGELYVANDPTHSILVFKADADGDVAPVRVLRGPKTLIRNPTGVYLDLKNDELWVANFGNHTATVYKRSASGDAPPLRVIRSGPLDAPAPMMGNPHTVAYDSKREELLVAN